MSLMIKSVRKNSITDKLNIQKQNVLISINGNKINDVLDYSFYQAEEKLLLKIKVENKIKDFYIEKEFSENIGLEFKPMKYKRCKCHCIFCFIDQIHSNARPSLKIKDDDFRLSFLYGNYISLTNLTYDNYQRIVTQNLSPLYVSVHTTNERLRRKIMKYDNNFSIMRSLHFFMKHRIKIHAQIVLIPDWNDDDELERTIYDLSKFYPSIESIAIVPVGLTKYRKGLTPLKPVDEKLSNHIIQKSYEWRENFKKNYGKALVSISDEFFLLAKKSIPENNYYDEYPQIDNGVGMVRKLIDNWSSILKKVILKKENSITIVTAELIYPILRDYVQKFKRRNNKHLNILKVKNKFFGDTVTVSGLLTAEDVIDEINNHQCGEIIILPGNMFNIDGITIDNKTICDIKKKTGKKIRVIDL